MTVLPLWFSLIVKLPPMNTRLPSRRMSSTRPACLFEALQSLAGNCQAAFTSAAARWGCGRVAATAGPAEKAAASVVTSVAAAIRLDGRRKNCMLGMRDKPPEKRF